MLVSGRPAYTVQFTLWVGDGMVELGPDAAESAQAQPFYFAEDLWSGVGGIRFCSRWPAFPLAGGRLTSRGIRFCCRWPTFPFIENASDQAGNLQAGTFDRVSFHFIEDASRWPAAGDRHRFIDQ